MSASSLQLANRCFVAKDYSQAIDLYLRHAEEHPAEAAEAYCCVAQCFRSSNVIRSPISIAPGVSLISQGDLPTAERYFRLALQIDPGNFKALWGLSEILPNSADERRELLERCVAVQPAGFNLIALGDVYRTQLKDFVRAYSLYRQAQECTPRDKTPYSKLSALCRRMGRTEEAKEWLRRWKAEYASHRNVGGKE